MGRSCHPMHTVTSSCEVGRSEAVVFEVLMENSCRSLGPWLGRLVGVQLIETRTGTVREASELSIREVRLAIWRG